MTKILKALACRAGAFARDEEGATAIEYCLIAVLLAVSIVGAASTIGSTLSANFSTVNSGLPS